MASILEAAHDRLVGPHVGYNTEPSLLVEAYSKQLAARCDGIEAIIAVLEAKGRCTLSKMTLGTVSNSCVQCNV